MFPSGGFPLWGIPLLRGVCLLWEEEVVPYEEFGRGLIPCGKGLSLVERGVSFMEREVVLCGEGGCHF